MVMMRQSLIHGNTVTEQGGIVKGPLNKMLAQNFKTGYTISMLLTKAGIKTAHGSRLILYIQAASLSTKQNS
jgi:hypothetical protein